MEFGAPVAAHGVTAGLFSQRGDVVYTSEVDDLLGFADVFPDVRVVGVGGS